MAERGEGPSDAELGAASQQLASRLDERNRQVAALAREGGTIPIDEHPARVIRVVVASVRSVMGDPILALRDPRLGPAELLPAGIHAGPDEPRPLARSATSSVGPPPRATASRSATPRGRGARSSSSTCRR